MDELTEGRFSLLEDRLEHYGERLDLLEQARSSEEADEKHAESMRLNWIVVGLFVLELVVGVGELWWVVRHA